MKLICKKNAESYIVVYKLFTKVTGNLLVESLLLSRGHTTELLQDLPRRKKRSKSAPATVGRQPQRGGKRKQWSNTSMQAVMKAVSDDGMSINKAAVLHGVPKTTLKDRLRGRVVHGTNPGPAKYVP